MENSVLKNVVERPTKRHGPPKITVGGFPLVPSNTKRIPVGLKQDSIRWEDKIMYQVDEENSAAVAAMTPAQVLQELEEARNGLSASAWAVLERRAQQRMHQESKKQVTKSNHQEENTDLPLGTAIELLSFPESRCGRSSATRYATAALLRAVEEKQIENPQIENEVVKAICTRLIVDTDDKYAKINQRDAITTLKILSIKTSEWPDDEIWPKLNILLQQLEDDEMKDAICHIIINRSPISKKAALALLPALKNVPKLKLNIDLVAAILSCLRTEDAVLVKPLPSEAWLQNKDKAVKIIIAAVAARDLELCLRTIDTMTLAENDEEKICSALLSLREDTAGETDERITKLLINLGQRISAREPAIDSDAMLTALRSGGAPESLRKKAIDYILAIKNKNNIKKFPTAIAILLLAESTLVRKAVIRFGALCLRYEYTYDETDRNLFIENAKYDDPANIVFALALTSSFSKNITSVLQQAQTYARKNGYSVKPAPWAGVLEPLLRKEYASALCIQTPDLFLRSIPGGAIFVHLAIFSQHNDHPNATTTLNKSLHSEHFFVEVECALRCISKQASNKLPQQGIHEQPLQLAQAVLDSALERGPDSLAAFVSAAFLRPSFPPQVRAIVWRALGAIGLHRLIHLQDSDLDLLACKDPDDAGALVDIIATALANQRDHQASIVYSLAIQHIAYFFNLFPSSDDFQVLVRTGFISRNSSHSERVLAAIRSKQLALQQSEER